MPIFSNQLIELLVVLSVSAANTVVAKHFAIFRQ